MEIELQDVSNPQRKRFRLKEETQKHLELGIALLTIEGIKSSTKYPSGMYNGGKKNKYFFLEKDKMFTWEELLPKIKKVMEEYYKVEIKLIHEGRKFSPLYSIGPGPGMNFLSPGYDGNRALQTKY